MGLTAKKSGGDFDYTPPPSGNHIARCVWLIDLGEQELEWEGKTKIANRVLLGFELDADVPPPDGLDAWIATKEYTLSLGERATLTHDLESWRGRSFTNEELEGFKLTNVVDKPCLVNIVHQTSQKSGRQYAKITGITPLPKGVKAPARTSDLLVFDMDEPDWEVFEKLGEYRQEQIKKAKNFRAKGQPANNTSPVDPEDMHISDDDIPF